MTDQRTNDWFDVENVDSLDSPALLFYKRRILDNIRLAIRIAGDVGSLRPHVKTNKTAEVCSMMMEQGIHKFKCATISEAEMLASIGAPDVLLAYPVVGPKAGRFLELMIRYPKTSFSTLVDNLNSAAYLSQTALVRGCTAVVYIDLNTGMDRSGIPADKAAALYEALIKLHGIRVRGLHAYDGHIRDISLTERQSKSDQAFSKVAALSEELSSRFAFRAEIVVGGSPTFPTHVHRRNVECSPGTFVFWDYGSVLSIPDQPFSYAALVMTRVVSVIDNTKLCTDLGHKSVAAENPLPRAFFLNAPDARALSQSEEHLVLEVTDTSAYKPGDVLYGAPVHICPTVALYERAAVIDGGRFVEEWKIAARDRKITV